MKQQHNELCCWQEPLFGYQSCLVTYMYGIRHSTKYKLPIPVASPSKAWVFGPWLAGIADSNPAGALDVCLLRVLCVVR